MEEKTFSPHPLTGASGTYKLSESGGYVKISDMDVSNESSLKRKEREQGDPDQAQYTPDAPRAFAGQNAAPGTGTGLLGTNTPDTRAARMLLQGWEQTQEMVEADAAIAASNPTDNPDEWTFVAGIGQHVYHGPYAGKNTATKMGTFMNSHMGGPDHSARRQFTTGKNGWHYGGDMMEQNSGGVNSGVWGNFTQDSWDRYHAAGGSGNPLIDTNPNDIAKILELYKSDTFNPYAAYGEEVRSGSVADVLYGITRNQSDISNRDAINRQVLNTRNLGSRRMTNSLWNELGLSDTIGEYNDHVSNPFSGGNPLMSGDRSTGSFNTAYNESRGGAPAASPISNTGTGSFLDAYNTSRSASRPDVRSLFKEMESYENE
jgi:hypothetical protein